MRVRMLIHITGTRGEQPWPPAGGIIEISDTEGFELIANKYAEEVTDEGTDTEPDGEPGPGSTDPTGATRPTARRKK